MKIIIIAEDMNKLEIAEKRDKQLEKDKVRFQETMKVTQEDDRNLERTAQFKVSINIKRSTDHETLPMIWLL